MDDRPPWKTFASKEGIASAHLFLAVSLALIVTWFVLSIAFGRGLQDLVAPLLVCAALVAFGVWRRGGERIEIHAWGVVIANLYKTQRLTWSEIDEIALTIETHPGEAEPLTLVFVSREMSDADDLAAEWLSRKGVRVPLIGLLSSRRASPTFSPVATPEAARALFQGLVSQRPPHR